YQKASVLAYAASPIAAYRMNAMTPAIEKRSHLIGSSPDWGSIPWLRLRPQGGVVIAFRSPSRLTDFPANRSRWQGAYERIMEPGSIPVAAVITVWRRLSHAHVLLGRLLEPETWGHKTPFALKLASVYADQFPAGGDLCRAVCGKHGVPIVPTIREAIGLGSSRVAVKGVLLIGEHGAYP